MNIDYSAFQELLNTGGYAHLYSEYMTSSSSIRGLRKVKQLLKKDEENIYELEEQMRDLVLRVNEKRRFIEIFKNDKWKGEK